ncbi:unnamed protein product [Linum trigynum]|uniref:Uncharacterized protein n=1 Tax=Linum trigynum TaxID=586398 RepID=A0AAV2E2U2_9ROSI
MSKAMKYKKRQRCLQQQKQRKLLECSSSTKKEASTVVAVGGATTSEPACSSSEEEEEEGDNKTTSSVEKSVKGKKRSIDVALQPFDRTDYMCCVEEEQGEETDVDEIMRRCDNVDSDSGTEEEEEDDDDEGKMTASLKKLVEDLGWTDYLCSGGRDNWTCKGSHPNRLFLDADIRRYLSRK